MHRYIRRPLQDLQQGPLHNRHLNMGHIPVNLGHHASLRPAPASSPQLDYL
jgi:hypothetical protein